jgi:hypothetical protein
MDWHVGTAKAASPENDPINTVQSQTRLGQFIQFEKVIHSIWKSDPTMYRMQYLPESTQTTVENSRRTAFSLKYQNIICISSYYCIEGVVWNKQTNGKDLINYK